MHKVVTFVTKQYGIILSWKFAHKAPAASAGAFTLCRTIMAGGWDGGNMAKNFAKKFYKSKAWQRCRQAYIDSRVMIDGGMCEDCREQLGYIVHHKVALTASNITDTNISLNHGNLMYVCKDCHDRYEGHGVGVKTKLLVMFDSSGQPLPPP